MSAVVRFVVLGRHHCRAIGQGGPAGGGDVLATVHGRAGWRGAASYVPPRCNPCSMRPSCARCASRRVASRAGYRARISSSAFIACA
eukprot:284920-Chlamydomonas_euryale.AAC.3